MDMWSKTQRNLAGLRALKHIHAQHGPYMLRYLNRLVGPNYAEDVLQDTFLYALLHD